MGFKLPPFEGSLTHRPRILVTNKLFPHAARALLEQHCDIVVPEGIPPTREEILALCPGVDGIIWMSHGLGPARYINTELLDTAGPSLKAISSVSAGLDHIDLVEIRRRNILIGYSPEIMNAGVAELAMGLLLAAARNLHAGRLKIDSSEWIQHPQWLLGRDIEGSTVGIVGFGNIGQTIAKRLQGFDVHRILYSGHRPKPEAAQFKAEFVSFDELLKSSDFVVIAAPLTNETRNLFNAETFAKMKPTSVLVNIARGQIVNTPDLVTALKTGQIFAAGLDVMDPEPLPADHELLKLPNVVLTPHLGTATHLTRENKALLSAHNILRALSGLPLVSPVPRSEAPAGK